MRLSEIEESRPHIRLNMGWQVSLQVCTLTSELSNVGLNLNLAVITDILVFCSQGRGRHDFCGLCLGIC